MHLHLAFSPTLQISDRFAMVFLIRAKSLRELRTTVSVKSVEPDSLNFV